MNTLVRKKYRISNSSLGVLLVLATETLFFAGLISAYLVARANTAVWPPFDQPRLPIERTAINTMILLLSAVTMYLALKTMLRHWLAVTILLGSFFVTFQGFEWARLLRYGLTTSSSIYGAFFYLIVGAHAIHVLAGLAVISIALVEFKNEDFIHATSLYWFFVVGLWPLLYGLVYLL